MADKSLCADCAQKRRKRSLISLAVGGVKAGISQFGWNAADEDTINKRKAECLSCEHYDFGVCNLCGCFLAAKVSLKSERCPKEKW